MSVEPWIWQAPGWSLTAVSPFRADRRAGRAATPGGPGTPSDTPGSGRRPGRERAKRKSERAGYHSLLLMRPSSHVSPALLPGPALARDEPVSPRELLEERCGLGEVGGQHVARVPGHPFRQVD